MRTAQDPGGGPVPFKAGRSSRQQIRHCAIVEKKTNDNSSQRMTCSMRSAMGVSRRRYSSHAMPIPQMAITCTGAIVGMKGCAGRKGIQKSACHAFATAACAAVNGLQNTS